MAAHALDPRGFGPIIEVLYVDDERHVGNAFRRTLARARIPVLIMESADEALAQLRAAPERYTVIAADFQMGPGMNGMQFLAKAAELAPAAARILVSGNFDIPEIARAERSGSIHALVGKPWDVDALVPLVERTLVEHTRRRAAERAHRIVSIPSSSALRPSYAA